MIRVDSCLLAASFGLVVACGSKEAPAVASSNEAGDGAGGASSETGGSTDNTQFEGGGAGFSVDIEDSAHVVLTSASLNCAGDCIDVQAVAQGGVQPYTYTWSDGATGPTRHLCPNATAPISVSVTDAGVTGGEFARLPETTKATLTIQVLSCSDGGLSGPEAGDSGATSGSSSSDGSVDGASGCGWGSGNRADSGSPPSCAPGGPGMTDCGANSESCCTSLEVTGGTYFRTYTNSGDGGTGEADPATVSCFRLDKYEVTVGRFRQFVNAWNGGAGYKPPPASGKHTHLNGGLGLVNVGDDAGVEYETGWLASDDSNVAPTNSNLGCGSPETWTNAAGSQENLPITCVNWYEAYAFCIWDGGFLPSEAEWEYAAAGGSQQREYPWGSTAPGTGDQYAIFNCDYPSGSGNCTSAPVGTATLGAGLWGQLDMAGEVMEWNLDWWYASYIDPCWDCAYLTATSYRVFRGGDYFTTVATVLLPPTRSDYTPSYRYAYFGVRCARSP